MTSATAVREQPTGGALAMWDTEQLDIITKLICPDATPAELSLFGQVCQRTGLDPFARQIYGIKRKGRLSIQTGIDGFRLQAQRSRDYAGQEGPQWCGEDGIWREVWLSKDAPSAARVGVYRKGWTRPVWGVATWAEYAQYGREGLVEMWKNMPSNQLAKCAEAQALRKAFPAELSGLYSSDEMGQADNADQETASSPRPIEGKVIDPPTPAERVWEPAYHQQWTKGAAKAAEIGAEIPTKPQPGVAGKDECQAALRQLAANIRGKERENLEAELSAVIDEAKAAGGNVDVPEDLTSLSDDAIRELIEPLRNALAQMAVPA